MHTHLVLPPRPRAPSPQGYTLNGRPIRVSLATERRNAAASAASAAASAAPHPADADPTNTTLFIGGLAGGVSEEQLRAVFEAYGEVVYTKVPAGKGERRGRQGGPRGWGGSWHAPG